MSNDNAEQSAEQSAERSVCVRNEQGLHARPAAILAREAQRFSAEILLLPEPRDGTPDQVTAVPLFPGVADGVDAKSILDILSLAAGAGSYLTVKATGADAHAATEHLARCFERSFRDLPEHGPEQLPEEGTPPPA